MKIVTFDIETSNTIFEDMSDLEISVVGTHDSDSNEYYCFEVHEFSELWKLFENTDVLVGYNSNHFDIPVLNKYYPGDLFQIKSLDLLKEIYDVLGRRLRLDAVAEGTLNMRKTGSGSDAPKWWAEGKKQKVKDYCLKDVEITKKIFDYALDNGQLKYKELAKTKIVELDTSNWLQNKDSVLTHTIGF